MELAPEPEVLAQCQLLVQAVVGLHPDSAPQGSGLFRTHMRAQDIDGTGVRGKQARQKPHRGGLSGTIGSEEPEYGSSVNGHRQTIDNAAAGNSSAHAIDPDNRGTHCSGHGTHRDLPSVRTC